MRRHPCVALISVYVLFVSGAEAPQSMQVGCSTMSLVRRAPSWSHGRKDPREVYDALLRAAMRHKRHEGTPWRGPWRTP